MKFRTLTLASAFALSLMAGPLAAQDIGWDSDGDGILSENEFGTGFDETESFGNWDEDSDGVLSEDEFNTGVFSVYDEDESGDWNEAEYGAFEEDGWF